MSVKDSFSDRLAYALQNLLHCRSPFDKNYKYVVSPQCEYGNASSDYFSG